MEHDFNVDADGNIIDTPEKTCTIKTAPDNVCQNVNGILDYNQAIVDKWSCCSQEDFLTLYRMDPTNFCLAEAEAATTTTTEDGSTEALLQILYGQYFILGVFGSCMF